MSEHPTSDNLRRYARGDASPADMLVIDDHLSACEQCRERLAAAPALAQWVDRLAEEDSDTHLTHQQLVAHVEKRTTDRDRFEVQSHLQRCASCREEVADLARFRDTLRPGSSRWRWIIPASAAAAIVLAVWFFRSPAPPPQVSRFEIPASWPQQDRTLVEQALSSGALPFAPVPPELIAKPGTLLGSSERPPFQPISPLSAIVFSDRPEFRWSALAGAKSYRVEIYTADFQLAAQSGPLQTTQWTPATPLVRGIVYRWQVIASKRAQKITAPSPPAAEARFSIVDRATVDAVERARSEPHGHLLAAVLLARAGLHDDALAELNALDPQTRAAPELQRLLNQAR